MQAAYCQLGCWQVSAAGPPVDAGAAGGRVPRAAGESATPSPAQPRTPSFDPSRIACRPATACEHCSPSCTHRIPADPGADCAWPRCTDTPAGLSARADARARARAAPHRVPGLRGAQRGGGRAPILRRALFVVLGQPGRRVAARRAARGRARGALPRQRRRRVAARGRARRPAGLHRLPAAARARGERRAERRRGGRRGRCG